MAYLTAASVPPAVLDAWVATLKKRLSSGIIGPPADVDEAVRVEVLVAGEAARGGLGRVLAAVEAGARIVPLWLVSSAPNAS